MRRAFVDGEKKEVMFSGQSGKCECCGKDVRGKKGRIRPPYWSHVNQKDCDSWYEPMSKWHLDWQNKFPEQFQEIKLVDEASGEIHRADIQFPNGIIIEVQNSAISPTEIELREGFYGRNGMIWILNGENLFKYSKVSYEFVQKEISLTFSYSVNHDKNPIFDLDTFNDRLFQLSAFINIYNHPKLAGKEFQNGYYHSFEFIENVDLSSILRELKNGIRGILVSLYGYKANSIMEDFEFTTVENAYSHFKRVTLHKKRWRDFVNFMRQPVYIDLMPGIDNDYIYFLNENKIISKEYFINDLKTRYSSFT